MSVARWMLALLLAAGTASAAAQDAVELPPHLEIPKEIPLDAQGRVIGRLWNLTDKPFTYQLARRIGVVWTEQKTIAPGGVDPLPPAGISRDDLYNLESVQIRDRFLVIQYPGIGGMMRQKLTGRLDAREDVFCPYYFYTLDPNGIGVLLQAENVAELRRNLEQLQAQRKLTPVELQQRLEQLRANYVLYPPPPSWYGVSPEPWALYSTSSFNGGWYTGCGCD